MILQGQQKSTSVRQIKQISFSSVIPKSLNKAKTILPPLQITPAFMNDHKTVSEKKEEKINLSKLLKEQRTVALFIKRGVMENREKPLIEKLKIKHRILTRPKRYFTEIQNDSTMNKECQTTMDQDKLLAYLKD